MSSNARDSRGFSVNGTDAAPTPVHGLGMKQWYVAVTFRPDVYDVLNTRTSEKNGAWPTIDAAAGNVTVSAARESADRKRAMANPALRMCLLRPSGPDSRHRA